MTFESLDLPKFLLRAIADLSYTEPTGIQVEAIPAILEGLDIIGVAQTGTGKTAAFALPILKMYNDGFQDNPAGSVQVLTLAPTRELALQVATAFREYAHYSPHPVRTLAVIGGEDEETQIQRLRKGVEIVVATPGRLLHLVERGHLDLKALRILVLDEADKLLDLGFAEELDTLLAQLPDRRQNLLFSATFPDKVALLSEKFLSEPVRVTVDGELAVVEKIEQHVIQVDSEQRRMLLQYLLDTQDWNQVLVFVGTKVKARNLASKLQNAGYSAAEFHGDLEQDRRTDTLNRFKRGSHRILIATDVAARGIDISNLSCVVNFDLPRSPRDYVHRIGRTGRAGEDGVAISFVDHETEDLFRVIEKRSGIWLEREQVPGFELSGEAPIKAKGPQPLKGKRKSKKDKLREKAGDN